MSVWKKYQDKSYIEMIYFKYTFYIFDKPKLVKYLWTIVYNSYAELTRTTRIVILASFHIFYTHSVSNLI